MSRENKIAVVSVINDLVTDNRVDRTCRTLLACGYDVTLVGRKLPGSLPLPPRPYALRRMRLLFKKGPLFYLFFNLRLFCFLLSRKSDLLYANDLDTLLPNYLVSRLKGVPLVYDSHELFCEVPELQATPFKKRIWLWLEKAIVPRLKWCITVNASIASIYTAQYRVPFQVVRNIAQRDEVEPATREKLGLPADRQIVLLQGAGINIGRGAEELVAAMAHVDALLLVIGGGDVWHQLEVMAGTPALCDKVRLINKMPRTRLLQYTRHASIGLSIDKANNLNYYNSLPNKVFDYIQAGVPILASRLPEIVKIVNGFGIGDFIDNHEPAHIASKLNGMLASPQLGVYRANTRHAADVLSWEMEQQKLTDVIRKASR